MIDLELWYLLTDPFEEFDEDDRRKEKERKAKENGRNNTTESV